MSIEAESKAIEDGQRIAAFLADEAVKSALISLEQRHFAAFKAAKTTVEREALHARILALDELFASCLGTAQGGVIALQQRTQRVEAEEREEARRNRGKR